ncbi:MAG: NAD(P)-dependent oxidoreductase [Chloroflexi bacterium]|nr:NAD(P)-dependent oxidoreductase [Chloroflexota bacterium]
MKVGYIGLGSMGGGMARCLLKAGHQVVAYNRSRGKLDAFVKEGGIGAASPREVAAQCDIVHTCLSMPPDSDDVYLGPNGLITHARSGHIFVEHSSIPIAQAKRMAKAAKEKGVHFLDAPISGGDAAAAAGTISIMVGGDEAVFRKVKPLLEAMGKSIYYCGPTGSGCAVKMANNMMVSINMAGVVEGMVLAAKAGVDPKLALEIFKNSSSSSYQMANHAPRMVQRNFQRRYPMFRLYKDLDAAQAVADEVGVRILMGRMAREVFHEAMIAGYGEEDMATLVRPLEDLVGVKLG